MTNTVRIIGGADVRHLLTVSRCIDAMSDAMQAYSNGVAQTPPRSITPLPGDGRYFGLMPGSADGRGLFGAKVVSLYTGNPARGLPAIQGFVALADLETGAVKALVAGAAITALRTAAASGLATQLLARQNAVSCGIFGTGVQAQAHIDAMLAVRPVRRFMIWGRDTERARQFAAEQSVPEGVSVCATADPQEVAAADILCTVTASSEPVLLGRWVRPGTHINLVGAHSLKTREADSSLIAMSRLYVDATASCASEGGDYMIPIEEGVIGAEAILGEIGEVAAGRLAGRQSADEVTVYNSLGIVTQDLFAAEAVYQQALSAGIGLDVTL
ncbi:MAG: ornithine cyclodeaminase family protein [Pseudomonadota bacterium]